MKTEVKTISPIMAKEMLSRNINNRPLSESHVLFLSKQMKNGEWLFDGQPIRFSENGGLLDGQHRLSAVIHSKIGQPFVVITGIDSSAFKVMDTGKNRSSADVLSIEGAKYSAMNAGAIKLIINSKRNINHDSGSSKISNSSILEFYRKNQEKLQNFAKECGPLSVEFGRVLTPSYILGYHYLFAEKNVVDADIFINKLCTGLGLDAKSPIYVLRKKLITDHSSKLRQSLLNRNAIIIKAWNLFRLKKECKIIRWDGNRESFPEII